jgi:Family of unknown function (DUF5372)
MNPVVQSSKVALQGCLVVLPRHTVHSRCRVALQCVERQLEHIDTDVVEQRGEPFLLLCPYPKLSTAPDLIDSQQVRIIHPFHPLCGRSFRFVVSKKLWGEDRVTIQLADGSPFSLPVNWTDVVPADAYTSVGGGRSRFRVEDLMALADLLALKRGR